MVGALIGTVQWLNSRFNTLERRLDLLEQKAEHLEDKFELAINGCREAISHARDRFRIDLERMDRELGTEIEEMKGYLQREGNFIARAQRGRPET